MKTINIIIPYFGNFPNYFQLFLNSCEYNSTLNWTILSDCEKKYDITSNVKIVYMTFKSVQERIRGLFAFEPSIDSVHKLCEYKPAYGYIFSDYIEGYDYWGYGDIDLIYGDLRTFLTDEIMEYDKIFQLGHLSLIKNNKKNNEMFMRPILGKYLYREAFSSPQNYNFDESFMGKPNINTIFEKYECSLWKKSFAADVYTKSSGFVLDLGDGSCEQRKKNIFVWNEGVLKRYFKERGGYVNSEEYIYIHLQKRKMNICIDEKSKCYKIIPNEFASLEVDEKEIEYKFKKIRRNKVNNQYFAIRYNNFIVKLKHITQ